MNSMAIPFTPPVNPMHHHQQQHQQHHHQQQQRAAPQAAEVDYQRVLNDMVMELDMDLPAVTSMVDKDKKLKRPSYLAKVKIGDKTWTSHPVICSTSQDAENEAIKSALKELTAKRDLLKPQNKLALRDDGKKMITENIVQIISEQQGGAKLMLHTAVAVEYAQKFKTPLPKNWIDFVADGGQLTVERQHFNKDIVLVGLARKQSQPDIEPVNSDWDVMATFEFSRMVDGRPFVATVHAIDYEVEDAAGNMKPVVRLSLCDTTNENDDVFIEQLLIEKNFAKRTL